MTQDEDPVRPKEDSGTPAATQPKPETEAPQAPTAQQLSMLRFAGLVAGPLLALLILFLPAPDGMAPEAWRMTAITV